MEINMDGIVQGAEMVAQIAQNAEKARAAVDEILSHIQQVHDAMEGISAFLRSDLMYISALLKHAKTKI